MWFIMGIVLLPSCAGYFGLGIHNVLRLLKIEDKVADNILKENRYNIISSGVQ